MPPVRPRRSTVVVAALVAGLLAAGAVASATAAGNRGGTVPLRLPPTRAVQDAVLVAVALAVVLAFAAVMALAAGGQGRPPQDRRSLWRGVLLLMVFIALALQLPRLGVGEREDVEQPPAGGEAGAAEDGTGGPPASAGDLAAVLVVVVLGAAVAVAAASRARARGAAAAPGSGDQDGRAAARALSDVLDDGVDDLRRSPDARRAVIATYDRMERVLAGHGLARRPSEAPLEYLTRSLAVLDASAPAVTRLTDLFAAAMFSTAPVTAAMQEDAVDALVAIRDELRALR